MLQSCPGPQLPESTWQLNKQWAPPLLETNPVLRLTPQLRHLYSENRLKISYYVVSLAVCVSKSCSQAMHEQFGTYNFLNVFRRSALNTKHCALISGNA